MLFADLSIDSKRYIYMLGHSIHNSVSHFTFWLKKELFKKTVTKSIGQIENSCRKCYSAQWWLNIILNINSFANWLTSKDLLYGKS